MANAQLPETTRVGRASLLVNDLDRLVEFYRDVVGLDVRSRGPERATLGVGETPLLELDEGPDAPARKRTEAGLFHIALDVPSRAALGDVLERVRERWRLDGASDHLVSEALYFADPEDNGIEVYRDRPRSEWPTGDDGTVLMDTLPLKLSEIAASGDGEASLPPEASVGHVHLEVSSLAAAREFYADALGMRVRQQYGDSALFVAAGDYHHHVGLNVWNGRTTPRSGRGLRRFDLVIPDRDALVAVRRRFDERGTSVTPTDSGFEVTDPDGITLRLRAGDAPTSA